VNFYFIMAEALITAVNSAYEDSISSKSTPSHSDKHANLEKHEKLIKFQNVVPVDHGWYFLIDLGTFLYRSVSSVIGITVHVLCNRACKSYSSFDFYKWPEILEKFSVFK
jgi:hypothetical protein